MRLMKGMSENCLSEKQINWTDLEDLHFGMQLEIDNWAGHRFDLLFFPPYCAHAT